MHQILKRLELIKTSIAIEDHEIIELQVSKLATMAVDNDVKKILSKLDNSDFGSVIVDIENYLSKYSGVVVYEDQEVQGLKLELKVLENQLQELSEEKSEYLNELNEFNTQYTLRLGGIVQKILKIKREIQYRFFKAKEDLYQTILNEYEKAKNEFNELKSKKERLEKKLSEVDEFDDRYDELYEELQKLKTQLDAKEQELNLKRKKAKEAKEAKNEFKDDEKYKEYEEAESDYNEFSQEYENVKQQDRFELNEEEKAELKQLFRKASKLCHPDIVADELREQATAIMQQLNDAYSKKDLKKVREILYNLENGITFDIASDTINDKERLKERIKDIRERLNVLNQEIQEIKSNDTFAMIQDINDMDAYFEKLKSELEEELERLSRDSDKEKEEPKKQNESETIDESDEYWNIPF
jgi:DNA repair exonuclease SbcCD ATPase subunit